MSHIIVGFSRSRTIIGRVIEWLTRGRWSHCMLLHPAGGREYLEASGMAKPPGVQVRELHEYLARGEWDFRRIYHPYPMLVWTLAYQHVGKRYDWAYLIGWALHRNWEHPDRWVCHELIAWACAEAGHPILDMAEPHWLTPQHLYLISQPMGDQ